MGKSLKDYAVANPPHKGPVCWVCTLPQRVEIDQALRSGLYPTLIREWLINECGYKPSECSIPKVQGHHSRGHHEKPS